MSMFDLAAANLLSPLLLCFALGALAVVLRSDLRFPEPVFNALSIYLMLAIGLKGGVELSRLSPADFILPALAALGLGIVIPLWCYALLRRMGRFGVADAAAVAAHYGSVSAVTFVAALAYLDATQTPYEGYAPALLAIMEVPAIVVAFALARRGGAIAGAAGSTPGEAVREILAGKSVLLLAGGLAIGAIVGEAGYARVKPVFSDLFQGALCLFLLELGMLAAARLADFRRVGPFLACFAVAMPILHGILGVVVGHGIGLSVGGATVLGTLAASASYIAAPAAVRLALPQANPGYYLTASLAITFPFNLTLGLPLFYALAHWIAGEP
jgi:uncharacterized protein